MTGLHCREGGQCSFLPQEKWTDWRNYVSLLKKHVGWFSSYPLSYCVCRIILCLFHEPISDNCALIAVRNCFSPGRECHQTSNFLFKPGNHFARGSSPVMMASINGNKAPVRVFFGMRNALLSVFPHPALVLAASQRDRWLGLEVSKTMRDVLWREVRRTCYLLHHYPVQQRDELQHTSVSATPAGKVQVV